jgi:transcriptional regulator with XRE-family HTH domain
MYGARIRQLRKAQGWTMKQLGLEMRLAESTISGYENENRRPDLDVLFRFATLFGVSIDFLVGRQERIEYSTEPVEMGNVIRESSAGYHIAILDGKMEILSNEEAKHLKISLEMFRLWRAKQQE